jgi:hypothetical protein
MVFPDWFFEKYDVTLFFRFLALPTYKITPAESINWYTPGLSGIRERSDLNFASATIKGEGFGCKDNICLYSLHTLALRASPPGERKASGF